MAKAMADKAKPFLVFRQPLSAGTGSKQYIVLDQIISVSEAMALASSARKRRIMDEAGHRQPLHLNCFNNSVPEKVVDRGGAF
jgi:hypothetical protein